VALFNLASLNKGEGRMIEKTKSAGLQNLAGDADRLAARSDRHQPVWVFPRERRHLTNFLDSLIAHYADSTPFVVDFANH
jgi:hypothetical protein